MEARNFKFLACFVAFVALGGTAEADPAPRFRDLFNGKNLSGWVNVNTAKDTWTARNGVLFCSGKPIGIMRTEKQYENFVLHIEWRHMEAGGNSGVFLWSDAVPRANGLPAGLEVQMLELEWPQLHPEKDGTPRPLAFVHGELFGVGGVTIVPDNPRGERSMSVENRCRGKGEWNTYDITAIDGSVKLAVNGKVVNGVSKASVKKGYICLESEGATIQFRNVRILELPPNAEAATSPQATPPAAQ